MYGLIDIAKIDNLENAPPEIKSIIPVRLLLELCIMSFSANVSTPGTVI